MRRSSVCRTGVFFLTLTCVQFAMLQNATASSGRIIYSFAGGVDGAYPESDLILDAAGNLYGTTSQGGTSDCGTVFELIRGQSGWKHQVLYSFNGGPGDGCQPQAGLVSDSVGNLYGTTAGGGANLPCSLAFYGCGTVFKLARNSQGTWSETVLYNFGNYTGDGLNPSTDLVFDSQGDLYGTTPYGGTSSCSNKHIPGCGTVFKLMPQPDGTWVEDKIYEFLGTASDGEQPITGVVFDDNGNIYGATYAGGAATCNTVQSYQGCGSIYQLMPSSGGWKENLLYSFHRYQGTAVHPSGGLIVGMDGRILGTSSLGGNGVGAIFELGWTKNGWDQTVRYRFFGNGDGISPTGRLALGANGHFFGVTSAGGSPAPLGYGTVFELVPTKNTFNRWEEHVLFNGDSIDNYPQAGPVVDSQGHLFGTFSGRYSNGGFGSIYEVTP